MQFEFEKLSIIIAHIDEQIENFHIESEKKGFVSLRVLKLYDYYLCQRRIIDGLIQKIDQTVSIKLSISNFV